MEKDLNYWKNRELGTAYNIVCPFCNRVHKQRSHINVICGCGAKFYYRDLLWMDRKTGDTKLGQPWEAETEDSQKKLGEAIGVFLEENSVFTPRSLSEHLTKLGFCYRGTARWITPTQISGRAYDIPHCSRCLGIPCGVNEKTKFCALCGAEIVGEENEST